MSKESVDDFNTPLFGSDMPEFHDKQTIHCVSNRKSDTESDSGSSNSSDSESVSGSESGSDSSKHSLKSDKSTQSEKCISFAKTGIDDSNSDDLDMNEEKISECIGGKCDTDAGDVVKSTICHKDTDSLDIYSGDRKTERKSLLDLKQEYDQQPELYGIRRSARYRKETVRYAPIQNSGSDGDYCRRRDVTRGRRKHSEEWAGGSQDSEDDSNEGSFSDDNYKPSRITRSRRVRKTACRSARQGRRGGEFTAALSRSRQRRLSTSGSSDSDDSDERRAYSRRQTANKVSYKEDSDDVTDSDDIVEAPTPADPEAENKETIDRILEDRIISIRVPCELERSNSCDGEEPERLETQYCVKWKNWAHIHNTWETADSLFGQKVNGLKKLENYIKRAEEVTEWKQGATPEEIDYFECQKEMMLDLYKSHQDVDRIFAYQDMEYMCKWVGLPYCDCTWEDADLITKLYSDKVDHYQARLKCPRIPSRLHKVLKIRPKFNALKCQPSYLGSEHFQLRDYQLDGVNWLVHSWCKQNSVILADEMGLGKTIQIVSFIAYLCNAHQLYGPFLIVAPLSTLNAWQKEFENWCPELNVVIYIGDVTSRNTIRDYEWCQSTSKRLKFNCLITTYEILLKDKSFLSSVPWAFLGVDEAHRLKNHDSLLYRCLFDFDTNHRILITGTPLQNTLKELWSLLHFIMPETFGDWCDFEKKNSSHDKEGLGQLHKQLEPYLLRRVKKDVEKSLPSKVEQILRVEMTSIQKQYYKWILTKNYKAISKGQRGNISSLINLIMELKKCCNHAHLTREEEEAPGQDRLQNLLRGSGKLLLLDKLLVRLRETGHRVLIFSQMVRMLNIMAEYMKLRHFPYQRLDGSTPGDVRKQAMDHFNADGSLDFCFLLSTRAGGLGVNLATADTVIIFDSDWNPQNDLQAQARAHRIGQKNQVSVYRLVTKQSVEETIVERAKQKMVLDHLVIQSMDTTGRTVLSNGTTPSNTTLFNKEELATILKFGAAELFSQEDGDDDEQEVDIDEVFKYAETRDTNASGEASEELLSQFKVVSFDNLEEETNDINMDRSPDAMKEWEEIIPAHMRQKVDEEERLQQLLHLNLPPRNRKTVRQLEYGSDHEKSSEKRKEANDSDASNEDDEDEFDDDERPKRRGRPRTSRDRIHGFTDAELRRFIKSYKRFSNPVSRLEAIAIDAELQEKSEADLKHLAEFLQNRVNEAMAEYTKTLHKDPTFESKKAHRGPSFKLSGVVVNVQAITKAHADLLPLQKVIPTDHEKRKQFQVMFFVKRVHWDCSWDVSSDSDLLKGIYQHGMGAWEAVKMDTELELHDRILPDDDSKKPQAKHIQTRAEYLLKILRKRAEFEDAQKPPAKNKKKRRPKSRVDVVENENCSGSEGDARGKDVKETVVSEPTSQMNRPAIRHAAKEAEASEVSEVDVNDEVESRRKAKKGKLKTKDSEKRSNEGVKDEQGAVNDCPEGRRRKARKQADGPMHFTASSEPISISAEEKSSVQDQDDKNFTYCKECMRPVKKALKCLDNARRWEDDKDVLHLLKQSLLDIGNHITKCLSKYSNLKDIKFWRMQLWMFVSNFTDLGHEKLRKLYKRTASKIRDSEPAEVTNLSDGQCHVSSGQHMTRDHCVKRQSTDASSARQAKKTRKENRSSDAFSKNEQGCDYRLLRSAIKRVWHRKMSMREAASVYGVPFEILQDNLTVLHHKLAVKKAQQLGQSDSRLGDGETVGNGDRHAVESCGYKGVSAIPGDFQDVATDSRAVIEAHNVRVKCEDPSNLSGREVLYCAYGDEASVAPRTYTKPLEDKSGESNPEDERGDSAVYKKLSFSAKSTSSFAASRKDSRVGDSRLDSSSDPRNLTQTDNGTPAENKLTAKDRSSLLWDSELTFEEEQKLLQQVQLFKSNDIPLTMEVLLDYVQNILNENQYRMRSFPDNRPGRDWYQMFVKQHPEVMVPVCRRQTARQITWEEERKRKTEPKTGQNLSRRGTKSEPPKRPRHRRAGSADGCTGSESDCAAVTEVQIDTDICSMCQDTYNDHPNDWIGCSSCDRWFHKVCIHIDVSGYTDVEIEELDFICEFCKNYTSVDIT